MTKKEAISYGIRQCVQILGKDYCKEKMDQKDAYCIHFTDQNDNNVLYCLVGTDFITNAPSEAFQDIFGYYALCKVCLKQSTFELLESKTPPGCAVGSRQTEKAVSG